MISQADAYNLPNSGPLPVAVNARWAERLLTLISLVVVDTAMIIFGFVLAYLIRFSWAQAFFYQHETSPIYFYSSLVFFLVPAWIFVFKLFGLYDDKNLFNGMREYSNIINACTMGIMMVILFTFIDPNFVIARAWLILSWILISITVGLGRFGLRRFVQHMRGQGRFLATVLIVGANEEGQAIATQLKSNPKSGVNVVGFVDDNKHTGENLPLPILGSLGEIGTLIRQNGIQEVIICSTSLHRESLLSIIKSLDSYDIPIRMSSGLYELLTTGMEVQEFGNVPLFSINKVRLTGVDQTLKRILDVVASIGALIVFMPTMVAIALIVKFDSSGPVFYLRRVVGVGGKPFNAFKFRTMYVDADERLARDSELMRQFEKNFKLEDDPRVTRIGKILRRMSLDELPQLFNVLLGQMSLVGPRMITEPERERYGKWQMNLSTVKPGITGLWQVSGRSDVSYEERVRLDMYYIRNYNIWFDLHILWQTVFVVIGKTGAY